MLERNLSPSTINVRLSAVRKLIGEAKRSGFLPAGQAAQMADIPNIRQQGTRLGNWLTRDQVKELLAVPDRTTLKGKRDAAILALLVGCALRRAELAALSIEDIQQRDGKDALAVNWLGVIIVDETGKTTYDGAFVTSLPVTAGNVVEVVAGARARWKNESFNVLKNNGYNLAHNFGHGKKYLAGTFATMNLLAFAFHTACDCLETLWQQAREAVGARARFFQNLHTITAYVLFPSWHSLINTLVSGKAPPI